MRDLPRVVGNAENNLLIFLADGDLGVDPEQRVKRGGVPEC